MIYIYKEPYLPFVQLANIISHELKVPNEITDDLSKDGIWIVFFTSYLYNKNILARKKYIVIQTENLNESMILKQGRLDDYLNFLKNAYDVWDYTSNFKLGYSKYYELEYEESKDIDCLFYGSVNERRNKILSQIPNIHIISDPPGQKEKGYFPTLWNYIRRSKITLCINFYDNSNTDVVRLAPLLSTRVFFISEKTIDSQHNSRTEYVITDYEKIPELCQYYLKNPLERIKYIESGYEYIKKNPLIIPNASIGKFK